MSNTVIRVENLSKLYRLGEIGTGSLAHDVNRWWHRVRGKEDPYLKIGQVNDRTKKAESGRRKAENPTTVGAASPLQLKPSTSPSPLNSNPSTSTQEPTSLNSDPSTSTSAPAADYVYALRDVSFDVKQGEVLGIIGRNGAGKSTLLKILSRVTKQTAGRIRVKGRIASLLEVGTGFHPELTGRENIFLNGAILGMRKHEIKAKFDEIVDFSGVERYIDTPVKRYSSGMYVRLAFAVAAHLEPEILIVDEVLAVGDAEFQKKCLGKMGEVAKGGRTVLFVSHNIEAVCTLCPKSMLLHQGKVAISGNTTEVVSHYLGADQPTTSLVEFEHMTGDAGFRSVRLTNLEGQPAACFKTSEVIVLELRFDVRLQLSSLEVAFAVLNFKQERLFYSSNVLAEPNLSVEAPGSYIITASIPRRLLLPGRYFINIALHRPNVQMFDYHEHVLSFEVIRSSGKYIGFSSDTLGYIHAEIDWNRDGGFDEK